MSKGTQLWPGPKMRAFFRAHILRETNLDSAAAERLTAALEKAVNRMLVWDAPASAPRSQDIGASDASAATGGAKEPPFNPYAFSAMVVLAKAGRDGLMTRLADIESVDNLKAFADAQHLAIDDALTRIEELRSAIVTAAEQRLADRKAAAS